MLDEHARWLADPSKGSRYAPTQISGQRFFHADLRRADFNHTTITDCRFSHCDLTGAEFRYAKMTHCLFDTCVVEGAKFSHVRNHGIEIVRTRLVLFKDQYYGGYITPGRLAYGCEDLSLADWEAGLIGICEKNRPREPYFVHFLRGMINAAHFV